MPMLLHTPPGPANAPPGAAVHLVLPRPLLDEQLALAAARPAGPAAAPGWLAHGRLCLQAHWPLTQALVASLVAGAPQRLPAAAWRTHTQADHPLQRPIPDGLALFYLAAPDEPAPGSDWDAWLARQAPEHRLSTQALLADLALLWLRPDGLALARFRPGEGWAALQATGRRNAPATLPHGWHPVAELSLPGAGMLRLPLLATAAPPAGPGDEGDAGDPLPVEGRHSRQAAALGPQVLARLQACRFGLVGSGRIGSVLAHSLVRLGSSLLVLEPDRMSPHSLDGDLPPLHEGRPKADALQCQLRGLLRPGARLDTRALAVASPAAGALLGDCDILLCCVDNDAARLWANAWALATLKPLLVVATGLHPHGAEADLRLLPPGSGCLACTGGFSQLAELPAQLALPGPVPTPADFRQQRPGSLRSWGVMAAHAGLRMVEHLVAGHLRRALFRRLAETEAGGLQVQDWAPPAHQGLHCPLCQRLQGAGLAAVQPALVRALAQQLLARQGGTAAMPALPRP